MWNDITFAQLLLYTEEMQSQQRAENGVKEIILGYYGHESETELAPAQTMQEAVGAWNEAGAGSIKAVSVDELPPDIREVFLAEQHRLRTGEARPARDFRTGRLEK